MWPSVKGIFNHLKVKWQVFDYNYHWQDYSFLFRGVFPRTSIAIPLVGYLIIFNDGLAQHLSFDLLINSEANYSVVTSYMRLRMTYFGLVLVGVGSTIYFLRRPHVIKTGDTFESYRAAMMERASPSLFINLHYHIREKGVDPYTREGKYYDKTFEDFYEMATGAPRGASIREAYERGTQANWPEAVRRYEPMLNGMLYETYFREGRKRRVALTVCLALTFAGYMLLFIPSLDLFVRVLVATFSS